ncbi:MAG: vanadium-dependent haloperoxidase, partial [Bacteroidota bacterium]
PVAHPEFSTDPTSAFYAEAFEVYTVTSSLTDEQIKIAHFWSDDPGKTGTPPGHSISVASQVLALENASLEEAAETFAKVGLAVHDAFISCWKCKYDYNLMRPVTFILEHFDDTYTTLLTTPPFPEYTSGHSVQSGASAQVLTDLFGDNYAFTDHTHEARTDIDGSPRSFDSFFEMAEEAAISRLYGGIHFNAAIENGVEQGKQIGQQIGGLEFKK